MTTKMTLYNLSAEMAAIEEALIDNGGELTPELEAALTATGDALVKKADDYGAVIQSIQALSDNAKAEIARIQGIKQSADVALKNIKRHLVSTMQAFDMRRLDGALHKFTVVSSVATVVDEDAVIRPYADKIAKLQDALPDWITLRANISRTALKDAFKDSDIKPDGVEFVDNASLRIR